MFLLPFSSFLILTTITVTLIRIKKFKDYNASVNMSKFADILKEIKEELFSPIPCLQCKSYKTSCPRPVPMKDLISKMKVTVKNPRRTRRSHSLNR